MRRLEQVRGRGARGERAAAEDEGQGLAGRLELVVARGAAELGEAAVEGRVFDEEEVEQLRAQVRDEHEREQQALDRVRRVLAQEAGVRRARVPEVRRRQVGEGPRLDRLALAREVEFEAKIEDLREPPELALEVGGSAHIVDVHHHHSTCNGINIQSVLIHDHDHGSRSSTTSWGLRSTRSSHAPSRTPSSAGRRR
jgi:hypothetical protein